MNRRRPRRPDARTAGHHGSSAGQSEISPLVRKGIKNVRRICKPVQRYGTGMDQTRAARARSSLRSTPRGGQI